MGILTKVLFTTLVLSFIKGEFAWVYEQSTGNLKENGVLIGNGYSGNGKGLNNPSAQNQKNVGPIPQGTYSIGTAFKHESKGPVVMRLTPSGGQNMYDRSGFLIHGDNSRMDHSASEGCIILSRLLREKISGSADRVLTVVK